MISCRELYERLDAYLDGELQADSVSDIKKHIEVCKNCVAYVNTYKKSIEILGEVPRIEMPERLKEILMNIKPRNRTDESEE